ncbi:response regulator transcription factor [Nakamurella flava]|uniref:Response regulator transcription factor n=1 Tax=Nakamurella flava TaxID=2576308 RepID=A0A4U6QKG9_9ACTN|nr:response regulator transcription factor [Nakamurella flava]TKV60769.1 response regulator transcription factor [Nakamurella flava]
MSTTGQKPAPGPRLLLVEDDRQLGPLLAEILDEAYEVDLVTDGQAGLHAGLTGGYAALVVDRGLPVVEGLDIVRGLRQNGVITPVLVLTARGTVADRVEGLDAGAEDYLVKPFEIDELLARLRALLRRSADVAQTLAVGVLRFDVLGRRVTGPDGIVDLSGREAALLEVLARRPQQVFTRPQLLAAVFDPADDPGSVDTYVYYLRRKLGRDCVQTVHGMGYRLGTP